MVVDDDSRSSFVDGRSLEEEADVNDELVSTEVGTDPTCNLIVTGVDVRFCGITRGRKDKSVL